MKSDKEMLIEAQKEIHQLEGRLANQTVKVEQLLQKRVELEDEIDRLKASPPAPGVEWEYGIEYSRGNYEFDGESLMHMRSLVYAIQESGSRYAKTVRVIRRIPAGPVEEQP